MTKPYYNSLDQRVCAADVQPEAQQAFHDFLKFAQHEINRTIKANPNVTAWDVLTNKTEFTSREELRRYEPYSQAFWQKMRSIFPQALLDAEKFSCNLLKGGLKGHLDNAFGDGLNAECQSVDQEIALRQVTPPVNCAGKHSKF